MPQQGVAGASGDDYLVQLRAGKRASLADAAKAKTGVQFVTPHSASASTSLTGLNQADVVPTRDAMLARIEAVKKQIADNANSASTASDVGLRDVAALAGGGGGGGFNTAAAKKASYGDFDGKDDRWNLGNKVDKPAPFELRAGFTMTATLISGVNSDLPGQIIAQISRNVYDTATGRHLLIPQGSRLVGSYDSNVVYGQSRVLVAWQRIIFPDGKALDIGAMPGADGGGYAGFSDQVNNHYMRMFGSALLMSAITAGVSYSQDKNNSGGSYYNPSMSQEMSQSLGNVLGQAMVQMLEKNMNISPTLEIRPGYRFSIVVIKDIVFSKPYRAFDY